MCFVLSRCLAPRLLSAFLRPSADSMTRLTTTVQPMAGMPQRLPPLKPRPYAGVPSSTAPAEGSAALLTLTPAEPACLPAMAEPPPVSSPSRAIDRVRAVVLGGAPSSAAGGGSSGRRRRGRGAVAGSAAVGDRAPVAAGAGLMAGVPLPVADRGGIGAHPAARRAVRRRRPRPGVGGALSAVVAAMSGAARPSGGTGGGRGGSSVAGWPGGVLRRPGGASED